MKRENVEKRNAKRRGYAKFLATLGVLTIGATGVIGTAPAEALLPGAVAPTTGVAPTMPKAQPRANTETTVAAAPASPRAARATIGQCDVGDVYAMGKQFYDDDSDDWRWSITTLKPSGSANQTTTPLRGTELSSLGKKDVPDALGIFDSGQSAVFSHGRGRIAGGARPTIARVQLAMGASARSTPLTVGPLKYEAPNGIQGGAVNPVNGLYYYGYPVMAGNDITWHLYAFDLANNRDVGYVGKVAIGGAWGGLNGDFAFAANGDLFFANQHRANGSSIVVVYARNLPAQAGDASIPYWGLGTAGPNLDFVKGMAWRQTSAEQPLVMSYEDSSNSGFVYTVQRSTKHSNAGPANVVTGKFAKGYKSKSGRGVSGISDLANCAPPVSSLTVTTNLPYRVADADQFTVSVVSGSSMTTAGTTTGEQPGSAQFVDTKPGASYEVRASLAAGSTSAADAYRFGLACVVSGTDTAVETAPLGAGRFTVKYPNAQSGLTPNVDCTLTPLAPATITVEKALPAGRYAASDQFTVQLLENGVVREGLPGVTTRGTGSLVENGTGTTGAVKTSPNVAYSVSELGANATTVLGNYRTTLSCVDDASLAVGLPEGEVLGGAPSAAFTIPEGAQVKCTLENESLSAAVGVGQGLVCEVGSVYGIANNKNESFLYSVNTVSTQAVAAHTANIAPSGRPDTNSLAVSEGGLFSYFATQSNTDDLTKAGSFNIYSVDHSNSRNPQELLATMQWPKGLGVSGLKSGLVRGGINPQDGVYWISATEYDPYGKLDGTRHHFWAYDTINSESRGYVGSIISDSAINGANGDLVFDQFGNMLFLSANNSRSVVTRIEGLSDVLEQAPQSKLTDLTRTVVRKSLVSDIGGGNYNGISFDNDGFLWATTNKSEASWLTKINPLTGSVLNTTKVNGLPSGYTITDLADCNDPGAVSVRKSIGGRVAPSDQFALSVTTPQTSSLNAGNSATTSGTELGVQTTSDRKVVAAGPVVGLPGTVYTLRETGTNGAKLPDYNTDLVCVDVKNGGNIPTAQNSQGEHTFVFPATGPEDGKRLANVVCTFSNSPKATVSLKKSLGGARVNAGDQFAVTITTASGGSWQSETQGSGDAITRGTGEIAPVFVNSEEITFGERAARGADLAQYPGALVTCEDPTGRQKNLPVHQPLGDGLKLTPVPMAKISCVIENTPGSPDLSTKKTITRVNGEEVGEGAEVRLAPEDTVEYQIETVNRGPVAGETVLTETVPEGTRYVGKNGVGGGEGWSCTNQRKADPEAALSCTKALKLAPGASDRSTFTVTLEKDLVDEAGKALMQITNIVTSSQGGCEEDDCEVVTPVKESWTVSKTAAVDGDDRTSAVVRSGQTITYTLMATAKHGETKDVVLTDDLSGVLGEETPGAPGAADFVKGSITWEAKGKSEQLDDSALTGTTLVSPAVTLRGGDVAKLSYSVTVKAGMPLHTIRNTVTGAGSVAPDQCVTGEPDTVVDACITTHTTGSRVIVEKLEENGDPLVGAEFSISPDDQGKPGEPLQPNLTLIEGKDGAPSFSFEISDMRPGSYWLTETKAPVAKAGGQPYQLLAEPIRFVVQPDGTVLLSEDTPLVAESEVIAEGSVIRVVNRPGFVLPNSGGLGTAAYTAIGVAILSVAMFALLRRRRAEAVVSEDD